MYQLISHVYFFYGAGASSSELSEGGCEGDRGASKLSEAQTLPLATMPTRIEVTGLTN